MTELEGKLIIGALLHDIGKVIYRQPGEMKKHGASGCDFLMEEVGFGDREKEILDAVRYHHGDALRKVGKKTEKGTGTEGQIKVRTEEEKEAEKRVQTEAGTEAEIRDDSLTYIVYLADKIAAAAEKRQNDAEEGFALSAPLQSVFNILNGNQGSCCYKPGRLQPGGDIPYPEEEKEYFDEGFYAELRGRLKSSLKQPEWTQEYINSLLEMLEANLSYVPSGAASEKEPADISLYDHVKITAAVSSCIYAWLQEKGITNYRERLFENGKSFYEEEAFILYSMDISGIQDFIYTIASRNAMKTLRARSFYLEIMMEHIIDCLLEKLHLSRANLIYSGGGHCYILMPNTEAAKQEAGAYLSELNRWLLETFQIALYVAAGYGVCTANALQNVPQGSYSRIFREISSSIAKQKSSRYTADEILELNSCGTSDYTRECRVCKRLGRMRADEDVCPVCKALESFSRNILQDEFFVITREKEEYGLPLPGGCYLAAEDEEGLRKRSRQDAGYVRAYGKNRIADGSRMAAKIWVGDYSTGKLLEEYAEEAEGISRIGILRADVDNLGQAFVSGFENPENQNRYVTLSRTATMSRQLSLFFKLHINWLLSNPVLSIDGKKKERRNALICYSGGDDLFIVGAWNEVLELAIDIRRAFERYTQGTLSLSGGIGIYQSGYPISAIAGEVAEQEEASKSLPGKNAVTLLEDGQHHRITDDRGKECLVSDGTYHWEELEQKVLGEKYKVIQTFLDTSPDRGISFLYHLLELIRNRGEKINFARYVYLLARMEPERTAAPEQREAYREFSSHMYRWIKSEEDCRQLKTAMTIYVYLNRDKEEAGNDSE